MRVWGRAARRIPNQARAASAVCAVSSPTPAAIAHGGHVADLAEEVADPVSGRDADQVEGEDEEGDAADPGADPRQAPGERLRRSGTEAKLAVDEDVPARAPCACLLLCLLAPGPAGAAAPQPCALRPRPAAPLPLRPRSPCRCAAPIPRWARPGSPSRCGPARTARRPSLGTIVAMDGGPGYASTAAPFARSLVAVLAPLLRRRDLVLFDERGTGRSDVVDCPRCSAGLIQEAIAVGECANRLGPRFAGYTTAEAAADLEAVRQALGLGTVFFYGDSYGTLFGQAYAVRYPGSLRGLVLDSAYPGDDPYYRTLLPAGLDGLRIACRTRPRCAGDPGRPLLPRRPPLPRRRAPDRGPARLPAPGRDPGAALLPQPRRSRPPLPRRRTAAAGAADRAGPGRSRQARRILLRPGDRGRVQRLPAALGPRGRDRRSGSASSRAAATRLPKDYFAPFGRREYLLSPAAHLTSCLTWPAPPRGRARTAGARRLACPDRLPDPGPRRRGRRRHLGRRRRARWRAASRAPACTWCRTAATPRASTSLSARRRWARSGTSSRRTRAGTFPPAPSLLRCPFQPGPCLLRCPFLPSWSLLRCPSWRCPCFFDLLLRLFEALLGFFGAFLDAFFGLLGAGFDFLGVAGGVAAVGGAVVAAAAAGPDGAAGGRSRGLRASRSACATWRCLTVRPSSDSPRVDSQTRVTLPLAAVAEASRWGVRGAGRGRDRRPARAVPGAARERRR